MWPLHDNTVSEQTNVVGAMFDKTASPSMRPGVRISQVRLFRRGSRTAIVEYSNIFLNMANKLCQLCAWTIVALLFVATVSVLVEGRKSAKLRVKKCPENMLLNRYTRKCECVKGMKRFSDLK